MEIIIYSYLLKFKVYIQNNKQILIHTTYAIMTIHLYVIMYILKHVIYKLEKNPAAHGETIHSACVCNVNLVQLLISCMHLWHRLNSPVNSSEYLVFFLSDLV